MIDIIERLHEEVKKARFRNDTKLKSRLHEAIREIEYFRWATLTIAKLDPSACHNAIAEFSRITSEGGKIGAAHPIVISVNPQSRILKEKIKALSEQNRRRAETTVQTQFATQSTKNRG